MNIKEFKKWFKGFNDALSNSAKDAYGGSRNANVTPNSKQWDLVISAVESLGDDEFKISTKKDVMSEVPVDGKSKSK
jgi:hypothetical protein